MRADVRGQDRPGHVGEAAREERRGQLDNVVLRLEPGDEVRFLLAADFAEADKGMHLVLVAAHGLRHRGDLGDIGIGRDLEQVVVAAQPPQEAVEQGEPLGATVQDCDLGQFDELGWDVESAVRRFERLIRRFEQFGRVTSHAPCHVGGFDVVQRQRPRRFAPAVEIGFAVEGDVVHDTFSVFVMAGLVPAMTVLLKTQIPIALPSA